MLSDEVKLYEISGPMLSHVYGYSRMPHTSKSTDSIITIIMLDSPENLYVMEWNLIVKPTVPCWEGRSSRRRVNEVLQTMVTRSSVPKP
jgi:hypothetical protein